MQSNRHEIYATFLGLVRQEHQSERQVAKRKMLSVFFWCFLLPALLSIVVIVLVKIGFLPRIARQLLDWLPLVFPLFYSLYFLSSEVLRDVPAAFRRGGIASVLRDSAKQSEWRERFCLGLTKNIHAGAEDWRWIRASFDIDLQAILHRTRYLTALAGAVFFLIMQGIDSLADPEPVAWEKHPVLGWIETSSNDFTQFVGLALFLVLLYLSGSQTYHTLRRFLDCVGLVIVDQATKREQ